jgi:hypothetical protein
VAARFGFIAGIREKQLVGFTLMVAFAVIMRAELSQSPQQLRTLHGTGALRLLV